MPDEDNNLSGCLVFRQWRRHEKPKDSYACDQIQIVIKTVSRKAKEKKENVSCNLSFLFVDQKRA